MSVYMCRAVTAALQIVSVAAAFCVLLRHDALGTGISQRVEAPLPTVSFDEASAQRCNSRNSAGVGLRGEYFQLPGAQGKVLLTRVDPTIEFDASLDWPADRGTLRPRSVRWKGWVKAPMTGRYRFHADPRATVAVSALPMAGNGAAPDASIDMTAGRFYPIVLEVELADLKELRLEWTPPHGMRYVVPRASLFLPVT